MWRSRQAVAAQFSSSSIFKTTSGCSPTKLFVGEHTFLTHFLFIFLINHDELQVTLSNMYLVSFVIPADERIFFFH